MNKMKKFYIFYIPGLILATLTSLVLTGVLTELEYADYTIYITFIGYAAFATFGFQDGMYVRYRNKEIKDNTKQIKQEFIFLLLFQILVFLVLNIIAMNLENYIFRFVIMVALSLNMIGAIKIILQVTNNIVYSNLIDLVIKIFLALETFLIAIKLIDFNQFLYLDIILKNIFFIFIFIVLIFSLSKMGGKVTKFKISKMNKNFSLGFRVMLGNWFFIFLLSIDKLFLYQEKQLLGYYAMASTLMLLISSLLVPLQVMFFNNVSKNIDSKQIMSITNKYNVFGITIATLYLVFHPIISNIYFLNFLQEPLKILLVIIAIYPMLISVQSILNSLMLVRHANHFYLINGFCVAIFWIVYFLISEIFGLSVETISIALILNFLLLYLVEIAILVNLKESIVSTCKLLVWVVFYILSVNFIMIRIIYIMICLIFVFIKRKEIIRIIKR
ncbi:MAG: hypothetical protein ACRC5R_04720 [Mycoplasmatales bacterium]